MIAHIKGAVSHKSSQLLEIDVAGIGYAVAVSDERLYKKDQEVFLHIYTHWNQDSGPSLYGFESALSKRVFALVLSCSGCGPKIGLAVMGAFPASRFLQIIATADARSLSQVAGIGAKKAELMIMQLKDKVAKMAPENLVAGDQAGMRSMQKLSAALSALHYKPTEVARALDVVATQKDLAGVSFDVLLKRALSVLAKR